VCPTVIRMTAHSYLVYFLRRRMTAWLSRMPISLRNHRIYRCQGAIVKIIILPIGANYNKKKQRIRAIKPQRHSAQAETSASRNLKTLPIHRAAYRGGRLLGNKRLNCVNGVKLQTFLFLLCTHIAKISFLKAFY
jgi:hypothetical protein